MGDGSDGLAAGGQIATAGEFSQLLFSDGEFRYLPDSSDFPTDCSAKMLCFGNYEEEEGLGGGSAKRGVWEPVVLSCTESSSASSSNGTGAQTPVSKSCKKRNEWGGQDLSLSSTGAPVWSKESTPKKSKAGNSTAGGRARVKKVKLGERITTLQQLVSPYGKTDTASVLHEALGYIRFLQDQVQVLYSPYLSQGPPTTSSTARPAQQGGESEGADETASSSKKNLRSRGLCLVPVACTAHVASSNGADFWSPAAVGSVSSKQ